MKRFLGKCLLSIAAVILVVTAAALPYAWHSSGLQYELHTKYPKPLYQPDPALGYRVAPNMDVLVDTPRGPVRVVTDPEGFRTEEPQTSTFPNQPVLMFFGDSFTWGESVPAEHAFPGLVSRELNVPVLNAAVSGYGLDQAVLRAEELVPRYRPAIAVLQVSPWLLHRATAAFRHSKVGNIPKPFFYQDPPGRWNLWQPDRTWREPSSRVQTGRLGFFLAAGLPRVFDDTLYRARFQLGRALGRFPRCESGRLVLGDFLAERFVRLCRKQGVQPVFMEIHNNLEAVSPVLDYGTVPVCLSRERMTVALGPGETFLEAYAIEPGLDDEAKRDTHYNARGHAEAAKALVQVLAPLLPSVSE